MPDPPCEFCQGACCTSYQLVVVELSEDERERFPEAIEVDSCGEKVWGIPTAGGRCMHLTEDYKCKIYDKRPRLCRTYHCGAGYYFNPKGRHPHSFFLGDHPEVVELLELHMPEYCEKKREDYRKAKERND